MEKQGYRMSMELGDLGGGGGGCVGALSPWVPYCKKSCEKQASAWGVQSHVHASAHAWNIDDVQKKARLVWLRKLQEVWQIACLK